MASRSAPKKLPVRGKVPGTLDRHDDENWKRFERVAQALRSLGNSPMTRSQAERLARRFGVHCSTIYRYRTRLDDIGTATAVAGHKRGWKSFASRLSARQEVRLVSPASNLSLRPRRMPPERKRSRRSPGPPPLFST